MAKKQMTMADVFRDLKPGYWRDSEGVATKALKDMDDSYLRNVVRFLTNKRYLIDFARVHDAEAMYEGTDERVILKKQPSDLQFLTKILEVNAEINSRRGRKSESKR